METMAGSTLPMTVSTLVTPLSSAGPAEISFTAAPVDPELVSATMPPPMRAPMSAAATTTPPRPSPGRGAAARVGPARRPPDRWAGHHRSPHGHRSARRRRLETGCGGRRSGCQQAGGRIPTSRKRDDMDGRQVSVSVPSGSASVPDSLSRVSGTVGSAAGRPARYHRQRRRRPASDRLYRTDPSPVSSNGGRSPRFVRAAGRSRGDSIEPS